MLLTNSVFDKSVFYWIVGANVKIKCMVKKSTNDDYTIDIKGWSELNVFVSVEKWKWPLNSNWTVHIWGSIFELSGVFFYQPSDCGVLCMGKIKTV